MKLILEKFLQNYDVPHGTLEKINIYVETLIKWNKKINLISETEIKNIENHLIDGFELAKIINYDNIYDLGSGNGIPGVILSIIKSDKFVNLIEIDKKKSSFLEYVKFKCNLNNLQILNKNINTITIKEFSIITARALANLNNLLKFSNKIAGKNCIMFFLKSENFEIELNEAKKFWNFEYEIFKYRKNFGEIMGYSCIIKAKFI